jgi:hypothetical protein
MTFDDLAAVEPALAALRVECQRLRRTVPRAQRRVGLWYGSGGVKGRMAEWVGWSAESSAPALRTSMAYDVAYAELYAVLIGPAASVQPKRECE